jgi:hypothetical protein
VGTEEPPVEELPSARSPPSRRTSTSTSAGEAAAAVSEGDRRLRLEPALLRRLAAERIWVFWRRCCTPATTGPRQPGCDCRARAGPGHLRAVRRRGRGRPHLLLEAAKRGGK